MFSENLFDLNHVANNNVGYIPGKLGFPSYIDQISKNGFYNDRNKDFDCRAFLSNLYVINDKASYIQSFTDEMLETWRETIINYRLCHDGDVYNEGIDEALMLLESELSERKNQSILQAGKKAEKELRFALRHLNSDYITIPIGEDESLVLCSEKMGIQHEYDSIVVSKYGVYIIECKNYKGELIRKTNGVWIRKKDGKTEVVEKNPVIQIDYQRRLLEIILKENGVNVYVDAIVCINNPTASVSINGEVRYSIVTLENLLDTIEGLKKEERSIMTDEEMENVVNIINSKRI